MYLNYIETCDLDHDGTINKCEVMYCIVETENAWRDINCPMYGDLYCENIYEDEWCPSCDSEVNCSNIEARVFDYMNANDTNGDGNINLGDYLAEEHYSSLLIECDYNMDGDINACEAFDCILASENGWRSINCPASPEMWCYNSFREEHSDEYCPECPECHTCEEL